MEKGELLIPTKHLHKVQRQGEHGNGGGFPGVRIRTKSDRRKLYPTSGKFGRNGNDQKNAKNKSGHTYRASAQRGIIGKERQIGRIGKGLRPFSKGKRQHWSWHRALEQGTLLKLKQIESKKRGGKDMIGLKRILLKGKIEKPDKLIVRNWKVQGRCADEK